MKLYVAVDLLGGKAVRLEGGRRDTAKVYLPDPATALAAANRHGVDRLHVVDLDAAFGEPRQRELVAALVRGAHVPVQVGGGIRDRAAIDDALGLGAAFVVLGTAAVRSPALVEGACRAYPGKIIVAVDARDGVVAVEGWTASAGVTALELGARAAGWGAAALLYTDIARDGLRVGPAIDATVALQRAVACEVIASGGVGSLDDLARLRDAGVASVVIGRAFYDGTFTIPEAAQVVRAGS
ncbi:MAG TPA: HisA/HisF-related TIM barrel protein [Kofleriaceae bacterium]|nr:HisA/HisF-related TIM barrel protein [Kofleriaceae bacterium]